MTLLWVLAGWWTVPFAFLAAFALLCYWHDRRERARIAKQLAEIRNLPETVDGPPMRHSA